METRNLYKIDTGNGCVISLQEPSTTYTHMYRLIADEGKALTRDGGATHTGVVDIPVADMSLWTEIDAPPDSEDAQADMAAALRVLGVDVDG